MDSPKSHQHKERKRSNNVRRKHKNKAFYNSKVWREKREAYLRRYRNEIYNEIPTGLWRGLEVSEEQQSYILSLEPLPCEICLRLYILGAYDKVEEGKELDHIKPINPEDPNDRCRTEEIISLAIMGGPEVIYRYKYGAPLDFNNLQLLCREHHARKSQRER